MAFLSLRLQHNTNLSLSVCMYLILNLSLIQTLNLESNWIGVEGATCIARILNCKDVHYLKDVSLAHNPGKDEMCVDIRWLNIHIHIAVYQMQSYI